MSQLKQTEGVPLYSTFLLRLFDGLRSSGVRRIHCREGNLLYLINGFSVNLIQKYPY